MKPELIAPCGMNCAICVAYFGYNMNGKKRKVPCVGCKLRNKDCAFLKKHCKSLRKNEVDYCYECNIFPCDPLKALDDRYRRRYKMSMIDNLNFIKANGMKEFLKQQSETYKCTKCGAVTSVHTGKCYTCS